MNTATAAADPTAQYIVGFALIVGGILIRHFFPALGNWLPGGQGAPDLSKVPQLPSLPNAPAGSPAWVQKMIALEQRLAQAEAWLLHLVQNPPPAVANPGASALPAPPVATK